MNRRRYLENLRPRDTREIVVVEGCEVPCNEFKASVSVPVMSLVDAMPREWRALIYEYGADAHQLYDQSIPQFANGYRLTAQEARRTLEAFYRRKAVA